jgi:hypothetical protein
MSPVKARFWRRRRASRRGSAPQPRDRVEQRRDRSLGTGLPATFHSHLLDDPPIELD